MMHYTTTFGFTFTPWRNNGTVMNSTTALTTTWVGCSVTPYTGLNSGSCMLYLNLHLYWLVLGYIGFSMYEVDPETFEWVLLSFSLPFYPLKYPLSVMEAYTWFADVSDFSTLDHQLKYGPAWVCYLNVSNNSLIDSHSLAAITLSIARVRPMVVGLTGRKMPHWVSKCYRDARRARVK